MKLKELLEQATPLPFSVAADEPLRIEGSGRWVAYAGASHSLRYESTANAQLIVHAVNMLPKLVEALERTRNSIREFDRYYEINGAYVEASKIIEEANNPRKEP